jgi:hypothetical protein
MSSVAYSAQPNEPGWWRTAWLVFLGWLTAALVLSGLYLAGSLVGAIGRNTYAADGPSTHAVNDWPFAENGTWSLAADLAVFLLALGITTVAVAWQLRELYATVAEDRLFVVLLFTGGAPFVVSEKSAPLFFVVAVWAVRAWVVRDQLRLSRRLLAITGVALLLTVGSYGLFHPVWVQSVSAVSEMPKAKRPTVLLMLHNASRGSLLIERLSAGGFTDAGAGWPSEPSRPPPLRVGAGRTEPFILKARLGTCGTGFMATVRYRVLGVTLHEPVRLAAPVCS